MVPITSKISDFNEIFLQGKMRKSTTLVSSEDYDAFSILPLWPSWQQRRLWDRSVYELTQLTTNFELTSESLRKTQRTEEIHTEMDHDFLY